MRDDVQTVPVAAKRLRVHPTRIYALIHQGRIAGALQVAWGKGSLRWMVPETIEIAARDMGPEAHKLKEWMKK